MGKSKIAQLGAKLTGGYVSLSPNQPIDQVQTRLLSDKACEQRVALLDNIKSLRFSWGELESLITADVISGRQLYVGEGQRPNTLTWVFTFNGASMSRDLAKRSIIIKVKRPTYTAAWENDVANLIDTKRWAIIGDIIAILRAEPFGDSTVALRWGPWESDILSRVPESCECKAMICRRQLEIDDDSEDAQSVRDEFINILEANGYDDPDERVVWFSAEHTAAIINEALGEQRAKNKATKILKHIGIKEIIKKRKNSSSGYVWRGTKAFANTEPVDFEPEYSDLFGHRRNKKHRE